jgi:hypothetical protein
MRRLWRFYIRPPLRSGGVGVGSEGAQFRVQKEHSFDGASMRRIEELLARGDTGRVSRAVAAYNQTVRESTNEFGYYRASLTMWNVLEDKK